MRRPLLALALSLLAIPALAQNQAAKPAGCNNAATAQPATGPAPASRDGTAPGNTGSTGWSGGTGGSYIGTNPSGALPSSPTWQPPTVRGLDPIGNPIKPAAAC